MLIDRQTGAISLGNGVTISPRMTRRQFEETGLMDLSHAPRIDGAQASYRLRTLTFESRWAHAFLYFYRQRLTQLSLTFTESEHGSSWETWSLDEQVRCKEFQEAMLRVDLGEPHANRAGAASIPDERLRSEVTYRFAWGEVHSGYDERASAVHLTIRFKRRWFFF